MVNNQLLNGMILQVGEQMEEQTHLIRLKFKGLGSNPPPLLLYMIQTFWVVKPGFIEFRFVAGFLNTRTKSMLESITNCFCFGKWVGIFWVHKA